MLAGFCTRMKKERKGLDAASERAVGGKPPTPQWVWLDAVTIKDTIYMEERKGDLLYRDNHDRVLNLTGLV